MTTETFDVGILRAQFPILDRTLHGYPMAYLDSAATAQKPRRVIEATRAFYETSNANINRGAYKLCQEATEAYEGARATVAAHLNAAHPNEIVFVRGTTEAMNLLAHSLGQGLGPGDEILLTHMEHHANIVPWQLVAERIGVTIRVVPVTEDGRLNLEAYRNMLGPRTRIVSVTHVSNALGTVNPVCEIARDARSAGAIVVVDGAQAAPHLKVDVQALGADFYAFSGHKTYGPTGIGAFYGQRALLEELPPYQSGGDMIARVSFEKTTFKAAPQRFEAGTPNIAGAVGLGEALRFLAETGMDAISAHECELAELARKKLAVVPGVRFYGTAPERAGIVSFTVQGVHPHDLATILDRRGVAIRAGHHCCQPLWERFGIPATARASFGLYNTHQEVEALVEGVSYARELFT
ncbi:MAG: cysteine desulfurase [Fimbriimonadaceae bacterium]|nr:cysteine desulfurase [Fimbriimonadaceae bacterium]